MSEEHLKTIFTALHDMGYWPAGKRREDDVLIFEFNASEKPEVEIRIKEK